MAPALEDAAVIERDFEQLPQASADQVQKGRTRPSTSAKELFYRNKRNRANVPTGAVGGRRSQRLLGRLSSKIEGVLEEKVSDMKKAQEAPLDASVVTTRGIRYNFLRRTQDGKDDASDLTQFSGNLADLQLEIEINISGYLYVLPSFEKENGNR